MKSIEYNENATVYIFQKPTHPKWDLGTRKHVRDEIYQSITEDGLSRFGWSYLDVCDLRLEDREKLDEKVRWDAKDCYHKTKFLLNIEPGDWIVHLGLRDNQRMCVAVPVTGNYEFKAPLSAIGDFRHCIPVDKEQVLEFAWNDEDIEPSISNRLSGQRRKWGTVRSNKTGFFNSLRRKFLKEGQQESSVQVLPKGERYFIEDLPSLYSQITKSAQKNHPRANLEGFIVGLLEKNPCFSGVKTTSNKKEHGADIVAYVESLPGFADPVNFVAQVKSFTGDHRKTEGVDQLKEAIDYYGANIAVLFSTGNPTPELEEAMNELVKEHPEVSVSLIAGEEFGKFVWTYFKDSNTHN